MTYYFRYTTESSRSGILCRYQFGNILDNDDLFYAEYGVALIDFNTTINNTDYLVKEGDYLCDLRSDPYGSWRPL